MSYQVLARKWRPRRFAELVGQDHVRDALANALRAGRLHHGYLFSGTRGVGKTTVARIFAKALNCERGVSAEPCGECDACLGVDKGGFIDLIEVDAASRTGVDDTRDLLEDVAYAPTRGRYKVYLIDEVHMFSKSSFNALLKTLEEPPDHVKFLLATTDPQKVPPTVLSRCLQFNLRALPPALIAEQLGRVMQAEQVGADPVALRLLADAARGSMRDALSLLDQAIAHGGGEVGEGIVHAMLGTVDRGYALELLEALIAQDAPALLAGAARIQAQSPDFAAVLDELMSLVHRLTLLRWAPDVVSDDDALAARLRALAPAVSAEAAQLWYQIALIGRRDLDLAPDPAAGLEMVLLRMLAFHPDAPESTPAAAPGAARTPVTRTPSAAQPAPPATPAAGTEPADPPQMVAPAAPSVALPADGEDWGAWVARLKLGGVPLQLARHAQLEQRLGARFELVLGREHEALATDNARQRLQDALSALLGESASLRIRIDAPAGQTPAEQDAQRRRAAYAEALESFEQDPLVRSLKENFDAELVEGSVQPLREEAQPPAPGPSERRS